MNGLNRAAVVAPPFEYVVEIIPPCVVHVAYKLVPGAAVYVQYIALYVLYEQVFLRCICSHRGVAVYHPDRRTVCVVDIHQQVLHAVFSPLFVENCSTGQGIGVLYAVYRLGGADSVRVVAVAERFRP